MEKVQTESELFEHISRMNRANPLPKFLFQARGPSPSYFKRKIKYLLVKRLLPIPPCDRWFRIVVRIIKRVMEWQWNSFLNPSRLLISNHECAPSGLAEAGTRQVAWFAA